MDHADNGRFRHFSFRCPVAVAEALEAEAERTFSTVSAIARQATYKVMRERGLLDENVR